MTDISTEGCHYGEVAIDGGALSFKSRVSGKGIFGMKLDNVEQCVVPQNNRRDLELQFAESKEKNRESLVKIVFHFPGAKKNKIKSEDNEDDEEESEDEEETMAEALQQKVMDIGVLDSATGDIIVEFDRDQGNFLAPRGKYELKFTSSTMQMRGTPYTFNIPYENMDSAFLLKKGSTSRSAFVVCLKSPIRVGNQKYQNLVLETNDDREATIDLNLTEEEIATRYGSGSGLTPTMSDALANLFARVFKGITGTKVFLPQKFKSYYDNFSIRCSIKANEGLLYPLAKAFIFIHKPTIFIKFEDIETIEFERFNPDKNSATRNFDMKVTLKDKTGDVRDYTFMSIDRLEYKNLMNYLESKNINVINPQSAADVVMDLGGDDDEDEDDDDDFQAPDSDDDDEDEDGDGSGSGSDDGSDNGSTAAPVKKEKKEKKEKAEKKEKTSNKRSSKAVKEDGEGGKKKKQKKEKDPNAPKGATTSFMVFSNDVRAKFKADNPGVSVTELSKLIGAKWREMTAEEKEPYEATARQDKKRYEEAMKTYKASKETEED